MQKSKFIINNKFINKKIKVKAINKLFTVIASKRGTLLFNNGELVCAKCLSTAKLIKKIYNCNYVYDTTFNDFYFKGRCSSQE